MSYKDTETEKQRNLYKLMNGERVTLAEGGGRSGKTTAIIRWLFVDALSHPGTESLIVRQQFNDVKRSVLMQTIPKLQDIEGVSFAKYLNKTDFVYTLGNKSKIWLGGLDGERREKVLGQEYARIYVNEASQIAYKDYEILLTRLNPGIGKSSKLFIDLNPTSTNSWIYKIFHERKYPDGRDVPTDDFGVVKLNPSDNAKNLPPEYIETLKTLSAKQRERFLYGNYQEDGGTLWRREWIKYGGLKHAAHQGRTVLGIDPSGSVDNDAQGFVVTSRDTSDNSLVVQEAEEFHGTPNEWAMEAKRLYEVWNCDCAVAEKNYGGDMVEATLRNAAPYMNVHVATSTRGKLIRAEPVSALYERGIIRHRVEFPELENEMCSYTGDSKQDSPNQLDALVFSVDEQMGGGTGIVIHGGINSYVRRH
jgi:PBSX family phage terminase large subunit